MALLLTLYISHSAEGLLIFYFCLSATAYILSLWASMRTGKLTDKDDSQGKTDGDN